MDLKNYLNFHQKTHLIFDLDETLVHLILPWEILLDPISTELAKTDISLLRQYKKGQINLAQLENSYISKNPKLKQLIIQNRLNFEAKYLKDIVANPELINFIKNAKNYQIFLWSSNTRPVVEKVLKKFKIFGKFKKLVTRMDVDLLKPEPEGFFKIYDSKIPKGDYLFIGNSSADRQAAQKVNVDFYLEGVFQLVKLS